LVLASHFHIVTIDGGNSTSLFFYMTANLLLCQSFSLQVSLFVVHYITLPIGCFLFRSVFPLVCQFPSLSPCLSLCLANFPFVALPLISLSLISFSFFCRSFPFPVFLSLFFSSLFVFFSLILLYIP
jgi:hypothetical protein